MQFVGQRNSGSWFRGVVRPPKSGVRLMIPGAEDVTPSTDRGLERRVGETETEKLIDKGHSRQGHQTRTPSFWVSDELHAASLSCPETGRGPARSRGVAGFSLFGGRGVPTGNGKWLTRWRARGASAEAHAPPLRRAARGPHRSTPTRWKVSICPAVSRRLARRTTEMGGLSGTALLWLSGSSDTQTHTSRQGHDRSGDWLY